MSKKNNDLSVKNSWTPLLGLLMLTGCIRHLPPSKAVSTTKSTSEALSKLSGTWAKMAVFTSSSSALGITSKASVTRFLVLEAEETENAVKISEQTCDVLSASVGPSSMQFPEALVRSIQPKEYQYEKQIITEGKRLFLPQTVDVLGVKLNDPLKDPLPKTAEDTTVFDQDLDGSPGVSVDVKARVVFNVSGRLYIAQRTVWSENLLMTETDRFSGPIQWKAEQTILGSSNALFRTVTPVVTEIPDESSVTMVKVADGTDCKSLNKLKEKIFTMYKPK